MECEGLLSEVKNRIRELKRQKDELETIEAEMEELIAGVLSPEQIDKINDIKIEYGHHIERQKNVVSQVQSEVKNSVLKYGSSVKHSGLHAVWSKGRVKWDSNRLDGYAVAHPEILEFRGEGKPSVSIRETE